MTRTLAVLSLLTPAAAYPLGIGEIKLHSALNQNLDAEISLMLSAGERISDVKVSLASPDKFDERGVPWSYFLSNISFEPSVRADGSAVIRVRSREALKEPILDLLLQVTWPKGTSYRKFSLLVDPPAAYAQPTVPTMRVPETIAGTQAYSAPVSHAPSYAPEPRPLASAPALAPSPVRQAHRDEIVNGVYGPTRKNDTLWGIAEKASRPYRVSVEQMMVAIYQTNPGAFYKDNMHALQARVKVKIPDRETVVKLSHQEALAEFNRQTEAWKNPTRSVAADAGKVNETALNKEDAVEKPIENQLTLAAPAEATVAEKAVITPGQEQNAAKTDLAKEEGSSSNAKANEEMEARLAAMEQQLAKIQALLTIKEQQLAALQSQTQQTAQPAITPAVAPSQPAATAAPVQPAPAAPLPSEQAGVEQTEKPVSEPVTPTPAQSAQPSPSAPDLAAKATPVKKPVVRPLPAPEPVEEPLPLGLIGGAGAAVLALLGLFWWRKRQSESEDSLNTESMFSPSIIYKAPETESGFSVPVLNETTNYEVNPVGESSFLSEFTPSDFDAFDNDQGEIDPISEADVYLAYGRYQQAEELIRNAIEAHPERDECKLKLLEIFYASENQAGFEAFAKELVTAGKSQDPVFWEKVSEMGQEMCPDSALFSAGAPTLPSAGKAAVAGEPEPVSLAKQDAPSQDDFDIGFDLDAFEASFAEPVEPELATAENAFADLDLAAFAVEETVDQDEPHNNASIDFDLGQFSAQASAAPSPEEDSADLQLSAEKNEFDFESLAFDLGSSAAVAPTDDLEAAVIEQLDLTTESAGVDAENAFPDDFNFDFDFSSLGDDASEDEEYEVSGVSDLTDMDELETKLDLARAYRDMGDNESAKDIVAEVLEKGSSEQKKLAQVLLDELI
ncbi:FimV/HubP family polar landmark protein [Methylomicrobium lacus]|uniref:FimV/HubP family polar landmark protein n=1 Tax=Methylomicrobium lacus TaxID=136992 RepID=UPI0035A98536